jgi:predicted RNase H-like HicB family nuclease
MPNAELLTYNDRVMKFEDYKIVPYRQDDSTWVAEIPALAGCYALMKTREEALAELPNVFSMVEDEYRERGQELPADSTEIVHA